MCGSGTASVVALTLGMNVVALDWNRNRLVQAAKRMSQLQDPLQMVLPSEELEIRNREEEKKMMAQRAEIVTYTYSPNSHTVICPPIVDVVPP